MGEATWCQAARRGAIGGLKAALVLQVVFWAAALAQGSPLQIVPLLYIICVAVGAIMALINRGR